MSDFEQKRQAAAEKLGISADKMPKSIAIIMDGNGRWAEQRDEPRFIGHREGAKVVIRIVLDCVKMGIEALSLYSFSMQNWKRPQMEVDFLMQLFTRYLVEIRPTLMENNVQLIHLGRREPLSDELLEELDKSMEMTRANDGMKLGLALNYGSREEIIDAAKKLAADCVEGKLKPDDIDEEKFSKALCTADMIDPELLIRTSAEMRISNFLLWQISYTEFYITDTLWPDFKLEDVEKAIISYANRDRRLGGVNKN
ncbi:Ditrans,polycis-undecaprenyl-diphosphate synthase ((2E,6E)-farnesyl-diphosphate specific) [Limihaloglobus sulfuriphilus]|uniref:Isoprenyl transferase n=1 Tax=Limihaloglobus sulfuriphilus TaxID=1851148 RepID=A0A1Q2MB31_9BACT|nr:isoprenyl transferase [Limihaloglobus sulfuriphilus]AQQ69933.1 Ditrans,polycis-undecaprenyl-diphosphate synthase ((2E,6E)-farnesyl-diphosphate specific) [Limihaloglobus sulfuriphilus]